MTNAEKYLKDGVSAREFREKLAQFIFGEVGFYDGTEEAIDTVIGDFLDMIEKPILTEDERAILRNIDPNEYRYIARKGGGLFLRFKADIDGLKVVDTSYMFGTIFKPNLFQFIKNGEEYSIEELLNANDK